MNGSARKSLTTNRTRIKVQDITNEYSVFFSARVFDERGPQGMLVQGSHAFWILFDDRGARVDGAGCGLRALPVGEFCSVVGQPRSASCRIAGRERSTLRRRELRCLTMLYGATNNAS